MGGLGVFVLMLAIAPSVLAITSWFPHSVSWGFQGTGPSTSPPSGHNICYNVHRAQVGWQGWKCDGQVAGGSTSYSIEAIAVVTWIVEAQGHIQGIGWTNHLFGWTPSGNKWGTTGQARRLEGLAIETPDGVGHGAGTLCGNSYVQGIGWQTYHCVKGQTGSGPHGISTFGTWGQGKAMYSIYMTVTWS